MLFFLTVMFIALVLALLMRGDSIDVKCEAIECNHLVKGKCSKKKLLIYDNGVKGMCFNHSGEMMSRVRPAFDKGVSAGIKLGKMMAIDELKEAIRKADLYSSLIADPKKFEKWMKDMFKDD